MAKPALGEAGATDPSRLEALTRGMGPLASGQVNCAIVKYNGKIKEKLHHLMMEGSGRLARAAAA